MSEWRSVRLEELAADERSAISKPYGSAMVKDDYQLSGVPVVRGVNLARGIFHDDDFVFISPELADKMPGAQLASGDLVITHRGTVGQVSMIPRAPQYARYVPSTSQVKVRLDPKRAVPEFFYYWFCSPLGRRTILEHVSTVGVPGLVQPVATVKRLIVPCPPPQTQWSIAEVLGALDEKIAANMRLSKKSIELAQALFEKSLASADVRWKPLSAIATTVLGGTPSKDNPSYWTEGTVAWLNSGKANEDRIIQPSEYITDEALQRSAAKLMPVGATLIAITGATLGQVARLEIEATGNQSLVGIWNPDPCLNDWLYFAIRGQIPKLLTRATGAAQQHVNKRDVEALHVPIANAAETLRFYEAVHPLLRVAVTTDRENINLTETRNDLLPQLMSGKLRVKDAERVLEDAVV